MNHERHEKREKKRKGLVPELRFPEFRDCGEWEEKPLSQLCEVNPSTNNLPDTFVYIDLESVEEGKLLKKKIISKEESPSRAQRLLKKGDVIFQMVRPYQKNNYFFQPNDNLDYVASTGYAQLRACESNSYLFQYLHGNKFVDRVLAKCTGSNYPAINSSDLSEILAEVPELPEQQKIADCLSSLDELITVEAGKLDAYKAHKKGLMQGLFPGEGETVPEWRFPEFRGKGEWSNEPLEQLYSFKVTNSFSREKLNYKNGSVKNIHYGDIHTKFCTLFDIEKEVVPFINPTESLEKIRKGSYCIEGDIIFADASEDLDDVGKSIELVNLNNEKLLSGLHTLLARQKIQKLIIGFGGYLFKSSRIRKQIQKEAQGAKVFGISTGRLANIKVCFPENKSEQQKIADCLTSLDELITAQAQKIETLKIHKKGLMQGLFPSAEEGRTTPPFGHPSRGGE